MSNSNMLRSNVLSNYRKILRLGRTWAAKNTAETEKERSYIFNEAKTSFRKNMNLTDKNEIEKCLKEAETRYSIAIHYRIPYPRPVNLPPGSHTKHKTIKKSDWSTTKTT